jgi:hypothetical protein
VQNKTGHPKKFLQKFKSSVTFAALVKLLEAVGHVPTLCAPTPPIYFGAYD